MDPAPQPVGPDFGKGLIALGILISLIGVIVVFRDRIPWLKSIGRLPGDIIVEKPGFSFYFPLMTSVIFSIVLSVLFWLYRKWQ